MIKKIHTAFISSTFHDLRNERNTVINSLLDFRILPIGMEHFTVSTNDEFSGIEELIDESDFFILLLGKTYGSCDKNNISWTEREYQYALSKDKPIIAIVCSELSENYNKSDLSEDEKRQVEFSQSISFARAVTKEFTIETIINQFFNTYNFSKCIGWTRIENNELSEQALLKWREEHKEFDISGSWYHVHLSDDDESYIRVGTIKIEQDFTPNNYKDLIMEGYNFNVDYYSASENALHENKMKSTKFTGEYTLKENGEIFGIFNSKRMFSSKFNNLEVQKGVKRGIHDFSLITDFSGYTNCIEGEFHDEAPSPKSGRIFLFRSVDDRNNFVMENRSDYIQTR